MKLLALLGSVVVVSGAWLAACGGASDSGLFGGNSSGTSGATSTSSGSSGDTSSSSTSSGTSGTTSTSSSGASGTSTSGTPTPSCSPGPASGCKTDEYCKVAACAATGGTCTKVPAAPQPTLDPQCGCDGVTYWNADEAAARRTNIVAGGVCPKEKAATCTKEKKCPEDTDCNFDQGSKAACTLLTPAGTCWAIPSNCPDNQGGKARRCLNPNTSCTSLCDAIHDEEPFFRVQSCN